MSARIDLLGDQMMLALTFAISEFRGQEIVFDHVREEWANLDIIFTMRHGKRWFLRQESLPGDLCVKALAVDSDGIYLETAPVLLEEAGEAIVERNIHVLLNTGNITDYDNDVLAELMQSEMENEEKNLAPRQLWVIRWPNLSESQQMLAIRTLDAIYSASAYSMEGLLEGDAEPASGAVMIAKPRLELRTDLMLQLELEQRPVLSISNELNVRGEMRLELSQVMALQQSILRMSPAELEEWIAEQVKTKVDKARVLRIFVFILAGKVRSIMPEKKLSWKQARILARRLIEK